MNQVTLIGALTKDPELVGEEGRPICRLRLVEAGAHPDHPLYVNVSVFGAQAEPCAEHLRKGSRVALIGRLRLREWQRVDLSPRSEHWIAADRVEFLTPGAARPADASRDSEPRAGSGPVPS